MKDNNSSSPSSSSSSFPSPFPSPFHFLSGNYGFCLDQNHKLVNDIFIQAVYCNTCGNTYTYEAICNRGEYADTIGRERNYRGYLSSERCVYGQRSTFA